MLSLSGPKALLFLQLLIALLTRSVVNVCAISEDILFVSLVTNRVSLEEVCLPSFDVLNCCLNLAESCLDDENALPLKIIALSASRFARPSIPLMALHSLVHVFWSKTSRKSLHFLSFVCVDAVLDVIIHSWQFRRGGISFTEVIVVVSTHSLDPCLWWGIRSSRFWSTSQHISPSGQQLHHSSGVCPKIKG